MIEEKSLSVALQVKKIDLTKKELTFCLKYPPYCEEANKEAIDLLSLLMKQNTDFFSTIPVRGLELRYTKYSGDDLK